MMTYAWTLNLCLDENLRPRFNEYTGRYLVALVCQLKGNRALYAEIRWRDPLD